MVAAGLKDLCSSILLPTKAATESPPLSKISPSSKEDDLGWHFREAVEDYFALASPSAHYFYCPIHLDS